MSDPVTPTTEPQPLTDHELAQARRWAQKPPQLEGLTHDEVARLLATVDAERARADALLDQGNHRGAVLSLRRQLGEAIARAEQAEAERDAADSVIRKAAGSPMWWARLDRRENMGWTDEEWAVICRALDASPTEGNPDE